MLPTLALKSPPTITNSFCAKDSILFWIFRNKSSSQTFVYVEFIGLLYIPPHKKILGKEQKLQKIQPILKILPTPLKRTIVANFVTAS